MIQFQLAGFKQSMMMTLWQALGLTDDGTQSQLAQPSFALQPNHEEGEDEFAWLGF